MLVDTHCHDLGERLVKEAAEAGVTKLVNIGTDLKENEKVLLALQNFPNVYGAIGIYPNNERGENLSEIIKQLEQQISESKKIVGIGECGIDISEWSNQRPVEEQIELFEMQLEIAAKNRLPVVIHNRNGDDLIFESLERFRNRGIFGVAHCFVSTWEAAKKYLDLNFYISFSGIITYKSGTSIHDTARNVPEDMFVVETDAPYLPPQLPTGKRPEVNEPKYVKIVAEKVAEIRNLPLEEIEALSYRNSCALFKI